MAVMVGASFTVLTVSKNDIDAVAVPSLTVSVMVVVPVWFKAGAMVTVRLIPSPNSVMFASGTNVLLLELAVTVSDDKGVSESLNVKGSAGVGVSSSVDWSVMAVMEGASFTELTVKVKLIEVVRSPSATLMVMSVEPF